MKNSIAQFVRKHPKIWFLLLIPLSLVYDVVSTRSKNRNITQQSIEWKSYEENMPEDGTQRNYWPNNKGTRVTYEFSSPAPAWNVLVRFFNDDSKVLAADLFIRARSKNTSVSLVAGRYKIVYAYGGSPWYGYKRLWGLSTNFVESRGITEATGKEMITKWRGI